ncbi:hypothetical protein AVEN_61543-1 [Araneus ventricosus]|uniref:Uncharacterized protein n=1 Tax=Araneus ventricosus TaxID=182803 RepID=A0A4Y2MFE6_ARAVE|nr:hypothetical protein AVEN_61543-1 [Araneus ventricosus]
MNAPIGVAHAISMKNSRLFSCAEEQLLHGNLNGLGELFPATKNQSCILSPLKRSVFSDETDKTYWEGNSHNVLRPSGKEKSSASGKLR